MRKTVTIAICLGAFCASASAAEIKITRRVLACTRAAPETLPLAKRDMQLAIAAWLVDGTKPETCKVFEAGQTVDLNIIQPKDAITFSDKSAIYFGPSELLYGSYFDHPEKGEVSPEKDAKPAQDAPAPAATKHVTTSTNTIACRDGTQPRRNRRSKACARHGGVKR